MALLDTLDCVTLRKYCWAKPPELQSLFYANLIVLFSPLTFRFAGQRAQAAVPQM